ncbi:MAG: gfo/Idh/MocA family oxidoreductase, partial [Actinobacteria bacterium]
MRELRYAIIGAGMMGREHIRNLLAIENCKVVAICDSHEPSRVAASQLLPEAKL